MTTSPEALREAQRDLAFVLEAYGADWKPDPHAPDTIYGPSLKGGVARLADVRGWGYLTGGGHGALGLPGEKAREIQDALGRLIAAIPALVSALQEAREALGPFVEEGLRFEPECSDEDPWGAVLKVGHFRRAAEVHRAISHGGVDE